MNIPVLKKIKLAKMLAFIKEVPTDKGLIVVDGELEVGNDVFIYDSENGGEPVPAPDGSYKTDELEIIIEAGKIVEVKDIEKEETPIVEEPAPEETPEEEEIPAAEEEEKPAEEEPAPVVEEEPKEDVEALKTRIAELEADVAERDQKIAELTAELEEYKKKEETPAGEPAEETNIQMSNVDRKASNALGIVSFLNKNK
jgi:hypothetical protein